MAGKGVLDKIDRRDGETYGSDVQMQGADISSGFPLNKLLFRERANRDVDNEAPTLQIQSDGPCQGRVRRTSYNNDLCPRAVGCSRCSSLLVICPSSPPYYERSSPHKSDHRSSHRSMLRDPSLSTVKVAEGEWRSEVFWCWRGRLYGIGKP